MDYFILTSNKAGLASVCIPELAKTSKSRLRAVILTKPIQKKSRLLVKLKRIFKKISKIGVLGAINGFRIRKWYSYKEQNIETLCEKYNIPFHIVEGINSKRTLDLIVSLKCDFGISVSNGYIKKSIFEAPLYGMINVHTELLPDYPGAQSVIWPIFDMKKLTGFTIHKINSEIDKGDILYVDSIPIKFKSNLRKTVECNLQVIRSKVPKALCNICDNYLKYYDNFSVQNSGLTRTTPTITQFTKIVINHTKLKKL